MQTTDYGLRRCKKYCSHGYFRPMLFPNQCYNIVSYFKRQMKVNGVKKWGHKIPLYTVDLDSKYLFHPHIKGKTGKKLH